jgi:hypothetical protein
MKLAFLGIVLLGLVGCSHDDPHAFIAPSSSAIVGDIGRAKLSAVKAQHGDKQAVNDVVDALSKAQADLGAYTKKVENQTSLLSKASDEANYWHEKQNKALTQLWILRGILIAEVLALLGWIGLKTSWRFFL